MLADLIAAGLVSHEMIGDPDRLGGETAALKTLCRLVAGPVWRIGPYHYAFRAGPGDLGGRLGPLPEGAWTEALGAALAEVLGPEAVWLAPTDLLPEAGAPLEQPLLLLRAQAAAVADGLAAAGPDVAAVISARYATEVARLSTGSRSPLAARVDFLAEQLETALAGLADLRAATLQGFDQMLGLLERIEAKSDRERAGAEGAFGGALAALHQDLQGLATLAAAPATFQETLGVTLAEMLARIERRLETAAAQVPGSGSGSGSGGTPGMAPVSAETPAAEKPAAAGPVPEPEIRPARRVAL